MANEQRFIKNLWYVAAWSHELDRVAPIARIIAGEPIVLYRISDGSVTALENRCPHRHAPLAAGRIEGDDLRCMYHGLLFGREGLCKSVPGTTTKPANLCARSFPAHEKDSWIWVWLGDTAAADPAIIPDTVGIDEPHWVTRSDALDYEADYQLIHDNLCDLSHLDFVHETTLGFASGSRWADDRPKVTQLADGLLFQRWFDGQVANPGERVTELIDTWNEYRFLLPGLFLMYSRMYPVGTAKRCGHGAPSVDIEPLRVRFDKQAVTPIMPGRSRYLYATGTEARSATPEMVEIMMGVINAAFAEDKALIESQQRIWDLTPADRVKAFIPQDKAPALFRRLIAQRLGIEISSANAT